MGGFAWVTLATNDSYSLGALVLAHSLRRVGTRHDLAVLITPGVTDAMREKLASVFNIVREVNVLDSKDEANLAVLQRPELGITFTKLHCWRLTEYEKCVFVDADALVVRNCDELFEREELSAAPDVGWPDCFNSGVFVYRPSQQTFASITQFAASQGSFDGADQGLLNMFFSDWAHKDISKHLPFIYNMCSTATYSYAPAFKQYGENVRIVHFIGTTKPWLQYFDTLTGIVQPPSGCNHLQPLLQIWWNIFCDNVHPQLTDVMAASNMSTIWHEFNYYSANSLTYNHTYHLHEHDEDMYNDVNSGSPDFSEFKDPWENYSEPTNSHSPILVQQTTDSKEPHCDTNLNYTEPHHHCGVEPLPQCPPSHQSTDYQQGHSSSHFHHTFQTSHEECSPSQSQTCPESVDERLIHEQSMENQNITDSQRVSDNCRQISPLCALIERFHSGDDNNHHGSQQSNHTDHVNTQIHSHNQTEQISCSVFNPSTFTNSNLHDSGQSSSAKSDHNQIETDMHIPYLSSFPTSCTDPNTLATDPEMSASPCIENANAGLAGALSKLTMGESRTDEQWAIEDHMRKQNWEQGHIDFMGRDSFDNILKKINQTLSTVPGRQPSPAKETRQPEKSSGKSSEVEAAVGESEVALSGTLKSKTGGSTQKVVDAKSKKDKKRSSK